MTNNSPLLHRGQEPERGTLYMVGTPIGNLSDISIRALNILKNVFLIACEDTRQTKKLMQKHDFSNKLISFNKYNFHEKIPKIIKLLRENNSIALVSDAGMPSICDPGEALVKEAKSKGINIICIPGACAATTALVSSGFSSSKFVFIGFLPKKKNEREKILYETSLCEYTTILYESPHRLKKTLAELKEFIAGEREIGIYRELTKKYEEHIVNNLNGLIEYFNDREIKGEITIIIKGALKKKIAKQNLISLRTELKDLIDAGLSLSSASKYLAKKENLSKNLIYNLLK